jgi:hypothetical protein
VFATGAERDQRMRGGVVLAQHGEVGRRIEDEYDRAQRRK